MSITPITYRNVKDSALTYGEMDDNFGRLANTSLQDVTENGNTTNLVIQVEGVIANTMTVNTIVITSDTGDIVANNLTANSITANNLTLNTGTDATGDLYYRDSSGEFVPLAIGSNTQVLTVTNNLPSWQDGTHGFTWSSSAVSGSQTATLSVPSESQEIIITWYYLQASPGADMRVQLANSTSDIVTSGYWYARWGAVFSSVVVAATSYWNISGDISDETYGVLKLVHMGSNQWHIDGKIIGDDAGVVEQQFFIGNVTIDSAITAVYLDASSTETFTGTFNIGYRT